MSTQEISDLFNTFYHFMAVARMTSKEMSCAGVQRCSMGNKEDGTSWKDILYI